MKDKLILVLIATLLAMSMIGCRSKEKQTANSTDSKATASNTTIDGYNITSDGIWIQ